jgi:DNA-binding FadR family transcriptional regulator
VRHTPDPAGIRPGDLLTVRHGKGVVWRVEAMTDLIQPFPGGAVTRRLQLRSVTSGRMRVEYAWACLAANKV